MGIRWSVGVVLGCALESCSQPEPPKASPSVEEGTASKYLTTKELAQLGEAPDEDATKLGVSRPSSSADYTFGFETRDHQLWLHTGTDPQLYTVKTKDGEVLADSIDDARLKLDFPELYDLIQYGGSLIDIVDY